MGSSASYNLPQRAGRLIDITYKLSSEQQSAVAGLVIDEEGAAVCDAAAVLFSVLNGESRPIAYAFTDEEGRFVFGPLPTEKQYEIKIWSSNSCIFTDCTTSKKAAYISDDCPCEREGAVDSCERDSMELYVKYKNLEASD